MADFKSLTNIFVFFFVCFIKHSHCDEPLCSRFLYEEKILEKMIRVEVKTETLASEIKETQHEVKNEATRAREQNMKQLQEIRTERENMKSEFASLKEELKKCVQSKSDEMKALIDKQNVAGSTTERCSDGWQTFQESCYFIGPNSVTFANAQVYCLSRGAHVVHVDNGMENQFLKSYLAQLKDNNKWNGLSDEQIDGVWRWTDDNNLVTFFDWGPGEPTNSHGGEACVQFCHSFQFRWIDTKCTSNARPICEKNSTTNN